MPAPFKLREEEEQDGGGSGDESSPLLLFAPHNTQTNSSATTPASAATSNSMMEEEEEEEYGDVECESSPLLLAQQQQQQNQQQQKNNNASSSITKSEHLGASRQYWRDIILGVNDGLISTFLLVTGVAGGGLMSDQILLTALAGALAGAVSMASGEYVATKSQNEVVRGEIALERDHVEENLEDEMDELSDLLALIGITPNKTSDDDNMHDRLLSYYRHDPEALLKIMTTLEFGHLEEEERSPVVAGGCSCLLFLVGSLPSVLPFIFSGDDPLRGLFWATACTITALLAVGAVKTWATRGDCCTSALENLIIAGLGGVLAYMVGFLFDRYILHSSDDGDSVEEDLTMLE